MAEEDMEWGRRKGFQGHLVACLPGKRGRGMGEKRGKGGAV